MKAARLAWALAATVILSGCLEPMDLLWNNGPDLPTSLLQSDPFPYLVVEVDHAPGHAPCPENLALLEGTLRYLTDKRRVTVVTGELPPGSGDYDNRELVRLHQRSAEHGPAERGVHGQGDTAYLHILILNGHAASPNGGHAAGRTIYDHGAVFLFPDTYSHAYLVRGNARIDASCDVERTVLLHELGHAFGLVNRGIPMLHDREHESGPGHSANPASVMHPSLRIAGDGRLLGVLPQGFDAHDLADLRAFRAG